MGEQDNMFGNFNGTAATSDSMFESVDSSVVNTNSNANKYANAVEAGVQEITAILTSRMK